MPVAYLDGALLQLHLLEAHKPGASGLHLQVCLGPLLLPRLVWGSVQGTEGPSCAMGVACLAFRTTLPHSRTGLTNIPTSSRTEVRVFVRHFWDARLTRHFLVCFGGLVPVQVGGNSEQRLHVCHLCHCPLQRPMGCLRQSCTLPNASRDGPSRCI